MFLFNKKKIQKISFEDMQYVVLHPNQYILINTLAVDEQNVLIPSTLPCSKEEEVLNELLNNYEIDKKTIIIYGKNTNDDTVENKYNQIIKLGFTRVYMYNGGIFEWLLLQDIYGNNEFPTTTYCRDILHFRPKPIIF